MPSAARCSARAIGNSSVASYWSTQAEALPNGDDSGGFMACSCMGGGCAAADASFFCCHWHRQDMRQHRLSGQWPRAARAVGVGGGGGIGMAAKPKAFELPGLAQAVGDRVARHQAPGTLGIKA